MILRAVAQSGRASAQLLATSAKIPAVRSMVTNRRATKSERTILRSNAEIVVGRDGGYTVGQLGHWSNSRGNRRRGHSPKRCEKVAGSNPASPFQFNTNKSDDS